VRNYLAEATRAAHRAADLTQQILAYAGKGRFVLSPMNLAAMLGEMEPLLRTIAAGKELRWQCQPGLPLIEADLAQVRQVIVSLITNASEALADRPGSITVSISVRSVDNPAAYLGHAEDGPAGPYVCLRVQDTGCGMSEETLARIFDPFFSTKFTGRGLGLAAVLGIVRAHRGLLRVTSAVGQGSTFEVLFPGYPRTANS
jgi:signal transduction histidine kinase